MSHQTNGDGPQAATNQIAGNRSQPSNVQVLQAVVLLQVSEGTLDGLTNLPFADEPILLIVEIGKAPILLSSVAGVEGDERHGIQLLDDQLAQRFGAVATVSEEIANSQACKGVCQPFDGLFAQGDVVDIGWADGHVQDIPLTVGDQGQLEAKDPPAVERP